MILLNVILPYIRKKLMVKKKKDNYKIFTKYYISIRWWEEEKRSNEAIDFLLRKKDKDSNDNESTYLGLQMWYAIH